MGAELSQKIEALKEMPLKALQGAYSGYFPGKKHLPTNRTYLLHRIAYKLQELEYGELSALGKAKLEELMDSYDPINNASMKPQSTSLAFIAKRDARLPLSGTVITKNYKGTKIQVKALERGFEYNGKMYKSLTAIAREITGAHWNGFMFFNL